MTIAALLSKLSEVLEQSTGEVVSIGPPSEATSGIFIWPWKVTVSAVHRASQPRPASPDIEQRPETTPVDLHFLIVAHPAFTEAGLSLLDAVYQHVSRSPLVTTGTENFPLVTETLPDQTLSSLFQSAGLPVTACVCVKTTIFD